MVQKIHPWDVIGVLNSGPYVKRFEIQELLSKCSILKPSLIQPIIVLTFFHLLVV